MQERDSAYHMVEQAYEAVYAMHKFQGRAKQGSVQGVLRGLQGQNVLADTAIG